MLIKTIVVGNIDTNCYVVTDEQSLKCAVIDPGADSNEILDYIESNKLVVEAILFTHGHYDHNMALGEVYGATKAPVYINQRDTYEDGPSDPLKLMLTAPVNFIHDGDMISVGSLKFYVIETPGHSPGSVTYMCQDALFTGDTLFRDSCGRTDLNGGDMGQLMASLLRLYDIPGDFEVYPGHMDSSTLNRERMFNYYMKYANEQMRNK
jgi:glyoxylase-like metal-dependent hydrolase (beta-lactamase superfamily II)